MIEASCIGDAERRYPPGTRVRIGSHIDGEVVTYLQYADQYGGFPGHVDSHGEAAMRNRSGIFLGVRPDGGGDLRGCYLRNLSLA